MPYTPTSPTLLFCDALADYLRDAWKPKSPDLVERAHNGQRLPLDTMTGRLVRIVPVSYTSVAASRGQDFYTHTLSVLTVKKWTAPAEGDEVIPVEWIDEQCDWVHTNVYKRFDFARDGTQPSFNKDVQTLTAEMEAIYDPDMLQAKVFFSEIQFTIQELEAI